MYSLCLISPIKLSPAEVLTVAFFGLGSICHGVMLSLLLSLDRNSGFRINEVKISLNQSYV